MVNVLVAAGFILSWFSLLMWWVMRVDKREREHVRLRNLGIVRGHRAVRREWERDEF